MHVVSDVGSLIILQAVYAWGGVSLSYCGKSKQANSILGTLTVAKRGVENLSKIEGGELGSLTSSRSMKSSRERSTFASRALRCSVAAATCVTYVQVMALERSAIAIVPIATWLLCCPENCLGISREWDRGSALVAVICSMFGCGIGRCCTLLPRGVCLSVYVLANREF